MNPPPPNRPRRLLRLSPGADALLLAILAFYVSAYYINGAFAFPLNLRFSSTTRTKSPTPSSRKSALLEGDPVTALDFFTSGPRLHNDLLVGIKKYPKVQKIVFFSANAGDPGMVHLQGLRELRDLTINSIGLTDQGLENIKSLTSVEKLNLTNTNITDAGLEHIKDWPKLKTLRLDRTKVTDAGLKTVQQMAALEELYLVGTSVTDAGLAPLASSKTLRVLWPSYGDHCGDRGLEHFRMRGLHQIEEDRAGPNADHRRGTGASGGVEAAKVRRRGDQNHNGRAAPAAKIGADLARSCQYADRRRRPDAGKRMPQLAHAEGGRYQDQR